MRSLNETKAEWVVECAALRLSVEIKIRKMTGVVMSKQLDAKLKTALDESRLLIGRPGTFGLFISGPNV
jgi:hypothetical protein